MQAARLLEPRDISVYVGIPFCPTRCAYCSFVSASTSRSGGLVEPYLQALSREIQAVGQMLASSGLRARTLYIGGGTPTTLTACQLNRLLDLIDRSLDLTGCLEYTVEAGRPDTITQEKLQVLARHGVGRVSINPQSMDCLLYTSNRSRWAPGARRSETPAGPNLPGGARQHTQWSSAGP